MLVCLAFLLGGCGGGKTPIPIFSSLSPSRATVGDPALILTVNGSNFIRSSVVRWDGADRTTTFISSNQLTTVIPATDLTAAGTPQVTVFNPRAGGSSNPRTFSITEPPGVIERVSVRSNGIQSNFRNLDPSISADGRFVAFLTTDDDLAGGDSNGVWDVLVRDTCFGTSGTACLASTSLISVASDGAQGNLASINPSISADGRFVAFQTGANNLVAGDNNAATDIFVRDTCAGAIGCTPSTILVSVASDGTQGNSSSLNTSISDDGRLVAFYSSASNLVAGDTNAASDIFVRDTCIGATGCTPSTIRVSVATDGTQGNFQSTNAALSANGRFAAFYSGATNLVADDTNSLGDIFVRDTCAGAIGCTPSTVLVSVATDGTQGNASSVNPTISADGRFVAFTSNADNLVAGDINSIGDIFVRDTCAGATACTPSTTLVSVATDGTQANISSSSDPSFSADGRFVAFFSGATNLVTGDTNSWGDIFVRDTCFSTPDCAPSTVRVSVDSDGTEGNGVSSDVSISADGRLVAFFSMASNLVPDDTNGDGDIFLARTGF